MPDGQDDPRQFSEMTDVSYESVCLLYSAYAVDQEEYGRIVGASRTTLSP